MELILTGRRITVMWKVTNQDKKEMYFSIGGHPAFLCPLSNNEKQSDYYISFDIELPIHYIQIDENGLAEMIPIEEQRTLTTENGILSISADLFDHDALIIENHQCSQVSLLTPQKKPYLTVNFNAPLFGLWSPAKKNAPFICIEPWYGRCDSKQLNGSLEDRDWSNKLDAGCSFETSYSIDIT
jgi:galactose mutarotase-like enzyme